MNTITTLFLIGSSFNLHVTRTGVNSPTTSNSGHICALTLELPALERTYGFGAICRELLKNLSGHAGYQLNDRCPLATCLCKADPHSKQNPDDVFYGLDSL